MTSAAPNQEQRKKCWDARDLYWKCLDDADGDKSKCQAVRTKYEASCTNTWVKYFDRRYDYLKFKAKIENEGFVPEKEKS